MNSYFASVEQQANPALRGKPVGVCATMTRKGCIIASSKEAKAEGIKTGCRVEDALAIDPNVILVEVDPPKYRSTTERIFGILAQYSEDIETYSIDEAFVNLTGIVPTLEAAARLGEKIKRRIRDEVGEWLTCSMGVAATRWLAKFGSDTAAKGGLVILHRGNLLPYLKGRRLTEAWGIAQRLETRLNALGIYTLDELACYPVVNLMEVFGIRGYELWANVNAIELAGLQQPARPKSVGHSHVLRKRTRDLRFLRAVFMRLCERTGRRLRSMDLEAHGVFASVGLATGGGDGGGRKLSRGIRDSPDIFRLGWQLVERGVRRGTPTFFAVGAFNLQPPSTQLSFWSAPRRTDLASALDRINDRFGDETIVWGPLIGLGHYHAPDRVGFRKTVSWDIPLDRFPTASTEAG